LEYSTMVSNFTLKRHAIWTLAATWISELPPVLLPVVPIEFEDREDKERGFLDTSFYSVENYKCTRSYYL
jgi:hypothetical protein